MACYGYPGTPDAAATQRRNKAVALALALLASLRGCELIAMHSEHEKLEPIFAADNAAGASALLSSGDSTGAQTQPAAAAEQMEGAAVTWHPYPPCLSAYT